MDDSSNVEAQVCWRHHRRRCGRISQSRSIKEIAPFEKRLVHRTFLLVWTKHVRPCIRDSFEDLNFLTAVLGCRVKCLPNQKSMLQWDELYGYEATTTDAVWRLGI